MHLPYFLLTVTVAPLLILNISARPTPQPRAAWARQARQRKSLIKGIKRWSDSTDSGPGFKETACVDSSNATSSPKPNLWSGLTDIEAATVTQWLFAQADLNLTDTDDAGEWIIPSCLSN